MEYRKRKPDYEDEYIRSWKVDKNKKEVEEYEKLESIKIKHRGQGFGLCGFSKVFDKETGKVLFYFKIKEDGDSWILLYYVVDDSKKIKIMEMLGECEERTKEAQEALLGEVNFECKDVRICLNDALENMLKEEKASKE